MTSNAITQFEETEIQLIEEHVWHLFRIMGFDQVTIQCRQQGTDLSIDIEAGDFGKMLIGTQGAHLIALQHILRSSLRRNLPREARVKVDVNGYLARREREIIQIAEEAAKKVATQGRTIIMQAMPPAERRVVHTALASRDDIATESTGEEPNRRVVIKPVFL